MKKMVMVLGLMVLALFVVACAPGETLAGQAVKTRACNSNWEKYCGTLLEGESQAYSIGSSQYKIALTEIINQNYAGGVHSATFNVNGKVVTLLEGEAQGLNDGKGMALTELISQNYAGGVHKASFCLG
ncbi:hypothetical protein J4210_05995 [Candidatus Woesearchaeota archaeon]|nr:hypothetical protein [Candidatus Woesearchaeota archaeon]